MFVGAGSTPQCCIYSEVSGTGSTPQCCVYSKASGWRSCYAAAHQAAQAAGHWLGHSGHAGSQQVWVHAQVRAYYGKQGDIKAAVMVAWAHCPPTFFLVSLQVPRMLAIATGTVPTLSLDLIYIAS
eukprot:1152525-Pelagomonas_calceolata.AAC.4